MTLIHNERVKLAAAALNTMATSCFTIGVLAPVAAAVYGSAGLAVSTNFLVSCVLAWSSVALSLHSAAKHVLGGLEQ